MSFPLMVRAIRLSLENVDRGLEEAARTLGAGALDRWFSVTLPLMAPGILAGAVTALVASQVTTITLATVVPIAGVVAASPLIAAPIDASVGRHVLRDTRPTVCGVRRDGGRCAMPNAVRGQDGGRQRPI